MNQTAEGLASTSELSPGDGRRFSLGHGGGPVGGVGQAGTFPGGAQVILFFNCVFQGIPCPYMGTVAKWDHGWSHLITCSEVLFEVLYILNPLENCVTKF